MPDGGREIMASVTPGPETDAGISRRAGALCHRRHHRDLPQRYRPAGHHRQQLCQRVAGPGAGALVARAASRRYPAFAAAERYAIHVLGEEQESLCRRFSRGHRL
jgi:hypothetical protein